MTLAPGTRLGPYEITAPLGAGGMGEVYRARDTRLGREVAIKVLPQHLGANAEVRARFEREAKTVSSLNHPNICTLFDVGRERDTDYLVMELIDGADLYKVLKTASERGVDFPIDVATHVTAEVATGLDYAHRKNDPLGRRAWDVYDRHFGRFTGASLDPELRRLRHAGRRLSLPRFSRGATVIVAGGGALEAAEREAIGRQREHVLLAAVPSTLASLGHAKLHADWVIVDGPDARAVETLAFDGSATLLLARHSEAPRGADAESVRIAPALPQLRAWPRTGTPRPSACPGRPMFPSGIAASPAGRASGVRGRPSTGRSATA